MDWEKLLQSSLILFAIVNPIGSIPIFLQLTARMTKEAQRRTFNTGVLVSLIILLVFVLAGKSILTDFFQIRLT